MAFEDFFLLSEKEIISILPEIETGDLVCALSGSNKDNVNRILNIVKNQLGSFSAEIMEDQINNSQILPSEIQNGQNNIANIVERMHKTQ